MKFTNWGCQFENLNWLTPDHLLNGVHELICHSMIPTPRPISSPRIILESIKHWSGLSVDLSNIRSYQLDLVRFNVSYRASDLESNAVVQGSCHKFLVVVAVFLVVSRWVNKISSEAQDWFQGYCRASGIRIRCSSVHTFRNDMLHRNLIFSVRNVHDSYSLKSP